MILFYICLSLLLLELFCVAFFFFSLYTLFGCCVVYFFQSDVCVLARRKITYNYNIYVYKILKQSTLFCELVHIFIGRYSTVYVAKSLFTSGVRNFNLLCNTNFDFVLFASLAILVLCRCAKQNKRTPTTTATTTPVFSYWALKR